MGREEDVKENKQTNKFPTPEMGKVQPYTGSRGSADHHLHMAVLIPGITALVRSAFTLAASG